MKLTDCLLASGAVGATLLTLFLLGGAAGDPVPAPPLPTAPEFESIVLHVLGGCSSVRAATDAHFVITGEGDAQSTVLWRQAGTAPSTGNPRVNRSAIVIAIESSVPPDRRQAALRELLARLADRYPGIERHVLTHGQVDGTPCGRGCGRID